MSKLGKVRRRKKYNYDKNRRKLKSKQIKKTKIADATVKAAWDKNQSIKQNFGAMGLSMDPNKSLAMDTVQETTKPEVREELEKLAAMPEKPSVHVSDPIQQLCVYLMDKYGEDYKAMARDKKNYYQHTPKQLKRIINGFKKAPGLYDAYKILNSQEQQMEMA